MCWQSVGDETGFLLADAAHVFQNGYYAFFKAPCHKTPRRFGNGACIRSEHNEFCAGLDEGFDIGGVAPMQSERVAIGQGPAHEGSRQ